MPAPTMYQLQALFTMKSRFKFFHILCPVQDLVEWEGRFPSAPSLIMENLFVSGLLGKMVG